METVGNFINLIYWLSGAEVLDVFIYYNTIGGRTYQSIKMNNKVIF